MGAVTVAVGIGVGELLGIAVTVVVGVGVAVTVGVAVAVGVGVGVGVAVTVAVGVGVLGARVGGEVTCPGLALVWGVHAVTAMPPATSNAMASRLRPRSPGLNSCHMIIPSLSQ